MQAELNLSEAAKAAGVNRSTIYRKVKKGEISSTPDASGNPLIHVAELQRVYPKLTLATGDAIGQLPQVPHDAIGQTPSATVQMLADNRVLQVQLEAKDREAEDLRRQLREEKERHDETRAEKARFLDMLEEAQKRIPALPAPVEQSPVEEPQRNRGFWARIAGK